MTRRRARGVGTAWPQSRGRDLGVSGLLFTILALGFGTPALLVMGVGMITLLIVAWLLVTGAGWGLRLRRTVVERRPRAGDDVHVDLALSGSRRSRAALHLCDWEIAPGLGSLGTARVARGARAGRRLRVPDVRRGEHTLVPARVTVRDPLGLVASREEFGDAARLLVVPRVVPATSDAHALGDRRQIRRASLGEDISRLDGVREYRPGDPLSRVHWGQTAKRGTLHTKVFHTDEAGGRVEAVLCDVQSPEMTAEDVELAVTAAASLLHAATVGEGHRGPHVHLWAGDTVAPVAGTWAEAETRLARLRHGQGPGLEDMLRHTVRLLPPGAGLVGITAAPTPGVWEAAVAARRRGVEAVVILVGTAATAAGTGAPAGVPVVRAVDLAALTEALAPPLVHGHRRGVVGV